MFPNRLTLLGLVLSLFQFSVILAQDSNARPFPDIPVISPEKSPVCSENDGRFMRPMFSGAFEVMQQADSVGIRGKFTLPPIPSIKLPFLLWIDHSEGNFAPAEDRYLSCPSRTWGEFTKENTVIRVTEKGGKLALMVESLPGESQPVTVYFQGEKWRVQP